MIKKYFLFILALLSISIVSFSQYCETIVTTCHYDKYISTTNKIWTQNSLTKTFQKQGMFYSNYIAFNSDSTFIFFTIYEGEENLTAGKWIKENDSTYILNWDKIKTTKMCEDETVYKKFYEYDSPNPAEILNYILIKRNEDLFLKVYDAAD